MKDLLIRRGGLLLVIFWLLAYVAPLGWRPLIQPDEMRYGEIAREMLSTGDWVVPHLSGLRYFEMPPLGHWMNAASLSLFGQNAFGIRFNACLSMGLIALAIWHFTRRNTRARHAGSIAALVFLSSPGTLAMGNYSALDGILTLWVALALMAFYHASNAPKHSIAAVRYALFGILLGLAFLTRGFLAIITPLMIIVPYMIWEKRGRDLFRYGWIALLMASAISLPWSLLIHAREPDFWHYFLRAEHVQGFYNPDTRPAESMSYYLPLMLLVTFPWLFLFVGKPFRTLRDSRLVHIQRLTRFCLCWGLISVLLFTIARSKLPLYILPSLVPMSILMGISAAQLIAEREEHLFQWGIQVSRALLVVLLLMAVLNFTAGLGTPYWRAHETVQWMWVCLVLMIWIGILRLALTAPLVARHWIIGLGVIPVFTLIPLYLPELVYAGRMPGKFLREQADAISSDTIVATDSTLLASASWYFKRTDVYLVGNPGEFAYGLSYPNVRSRHIPTGEFENFIANTDRAVAYFDKFGGKPPPNNLPSGASEGVMGRFILFRYYPTQDGTP